VLTACCALVALAPASAGAAAASFAGTTKTGETVFFTTTEKLVPGDTDSRADLYERSYDEALERYVTRQVSVGPIGGNDAYPALFVGTSENGTLAFFATEESLTSEDEDLSEDIYVRDLDQNVTELVSTGDELTCGECGNAEIDASFVQGGVIPSGQEVFFRSAEKLSSADKDGSVDVYVRDLTANTTTLVSAGATGCAGSGCGEGAFAASFRATSTDGTKAFFTTDERLAGNDTDSLIDVYRRDIAGGSTVLVSLPGTCPVAADCSASFGGASVDGSHAYFETLERLAPEDEDSSQDVYDWSGGAVVLVSRGLVNGNGLPSATFAGASSDGARVFFETEESLLVEDGDQATDVYERVSGTTNLVSTGPDAEDAETAASLEWVSPDGSDSSVLIGTDEQLTANDEDAFYDVYRRAGGTTTLLTATASSGNGPYNAAFAGASADGSHVFVVTAEPLAGSGDPDTGADVYEVDGAAATLVSTGPEAGKSSVPAGLPAGGISGDGSHAFFITEERVTEADLDAETDVYDRFAGETRLASTGNSAPLGPPTPSQLTTEPGSPGSSLTPKIKGQSDPNTAIKIYTTPDCSGAPVTTGTSLQLGGSGIGVTVIAGSTTSFRATATDLNGDTSPCSAAVSYTHQESTPPPPPAEEVGTGGTGGGSSGTGGSGSTGGTGGGNKPKGGVIYVTPHTRITFAPASKTRARRPVFRFTDTTEQPGTSFKCKVDRSRWKGCTSPVKVPKLKLGRHVFQVKGINAVGTREPAAVKRSFKVVR
jgi:hypothetical protein